jgi:hypothetical protein
LSFPSSVILCSGAFLLAETGVVAGPLVSTHHICADALAKRFPGITVIRLWHSASRGDGKKGWDRPLTLAKDRFVIAAGPNSSGSVTRALARALETRRAKYSAPLPQDQRLALGVLVKALKAEWKTVTKQPARGSEIRTLLPFIVVIPFDMAGPDRAAAIAGAGHLVTRAASAANAFVAIEKHCQQLMEGRLGGDAAQFRTALSALGIPLKAPPSYEADVSAASTVGAPGAAD